LYNAPSTFPSRGICQVNFRKIVHYPETPLAVEYQNKINAGISIGNVGRIVSTGAVTSPIVTNTTTTYDQPVTNVVNGPVTGSTYIGGGQYVGGSTLIGGGSLVGGTRYVSGAPTTTFVANPAQTVYVGNNAPVTTEYVTYESNAYPAGTTTTETVTYETVNAPTYTTVGGPTYTTVGGPTYTSGARYV